MRTLRLLTATALLALAANPTFAADLRIGLQEDPDVLDPDQSRTFVGRIVYASLCDKLVDITPDLKIIPMLATGWAWGDDGKSLTLTIREGVKFHDGTDLDAEAVKANIERSRDLKESRRKSEVASVDTVEVAGPHEVLIKLKAPDATLLAQFADRAGMMVSPKAANEMGLDFGNSPVCSGPFKFVERVQQGRIVLEKFADYWDKDKIAIDKVTFLPIPDTTVRLANLRSGDLDMIERLATSDASSVKADSGLQYAEAVSLGYQGITLNIANGERAKNPFGEDKRVRQALSLAIDRDALNQVVFEGTFSAGNQPYPPSSPWYNQSIAVPKRDLDRAKALLKEAGHDNISVELQFANSQEPTQVAQVIQAMAAEAGIDVQLRATEFATQLKEQTAGNYTLSQIGWSGRVDPDGNIHQFTTCAGGINDSKYCNEAIDKLLNEARVSTDPEVRKKSYDAAAEILADELPIIYLYHPTWIWALSTKVQGFVPYPDGMIRLQNVKVSG